MREAEETVRKLNALRGTAAQRLEERVLEHVDGAVERPSSWKRLIGRTELPADDLHDRVKAIGSAENA